MSEKEIKSIEMEVKFSNFKVLNPDFTRCRCNVFYTGRNRNYTDITPDALNKLIARKGYANIPVIGHIRQNGTMGGHDRKIEISDEGIDFINECVPYGVVPEDCNPAMDKIIDVHGIEKEYFSVDLILWTSYFPEIMDTIGDPNVFFGQSMEIEILDYGFDGDYTVINDFSLQALCLLGKYNDSERKDQSTEPCFEDSIVRRFSINENSFKANFELMLEKLKSYESDVKPVQDKNNFKKEENTNMNREKILETLSAVTYENALGETVPQYGLIDISETSIGVIDRQDNKAYSVNWAESEDKVVLDFDNRVECSFAVKEKADEDFDYAAEVTLVSDFASKVKENELTASTSEVMAKEMEKYNAQVAELTSAYKELKADYDAKSVELDKYRADDEKRKIEKHNADVEALYNKFSGKIGRVPEFLCYRANMENKQKDLETIEAELTVMAGKAMMNKTSKQNFSFEPVSAGMTPVVSEKELAYTNRYGNLLDKWKKD